MQKRLLPVLLLFIVTSGFAQKLEIRASLNSNLFSFAGQSAEEVSYFNFGSTHTYTNTPYGAKNGVGYGISGSVQYVGKKNFIAGADVGYERAASKVSINNVIVLSSSSLGTLATGRTLLKYDFINLFPYTGYRFHPGKVNLDVTAGVDIAYCLKAREDGEATTSSGTKYTTSVDRKTIKVDVRPRVQLAASYKRAGVYVGYSYGLANYMSGFVGGVNESYARMIRFGVRYQLK